MLHQLLQHHFPVLEEVSRDTLRLGSCMKCERCIFFPNSFKCCDKCLPVTTKRIFPAKPIFPHIMDSSYVQTLLFYCFLWWQKEERPIMSHFAFLEWLYNMSSHNYQKNEIKHGIIPRIFLKMFFLIWKC